MALTEAERKARGIWRDNGDVRREGRLGDFMQRQGEALDQQAAARMDARERRLAANRQIAINEPGRYSAQFTNEARRIEQRRGLEAHELEMLKQTGANEQALQGLKNVGMKEQGMEAARLNGESAKELEVVRGENARKLEGIRNEHSLTVAKQQLESQEKIAGITAGSAERVANINADAQRYAADSQVDVQTERNRGIKDQAEIERNAKEFEHQHAKELAQMRIEGLQPNRSEMSMMWSMMAKPEYKDMTPGELLQVIRRGGK